MACPATDVCPRPVGARNEHYDAQHGNTTSDGRAEIVTTYRHEGTFMTVPSIAPCARVQRPASVLTIEERVNRMVTPCKKTCAVRMDLSRPAGCLIEWVAGEVWPAVLPDDSRRVFQDVGGH
jgi:hypothetical protein